MKFGYTIIYVPDVAQAVEFYEQVFGLERRFVHESGQYAEMETGATTLSFASNRFVDENYGVAFRTNDSGQPPVGIQITLTTEDVAGAYAHAVEAGAAPLVEPVDKPWGQTVSYVKDLNGVLVEIASPMG